MNGGGNERLWTILVVVLLVAVAECSPQQPPSGTATPDRPQPETSTSDDASVIAAAAREPARELSLEEGIAEGLVEAQFRGTGGASGDVIIVRVRRLVESEISLSVTLGAALRNSSPAEQDMVVRGLRGELAGEGRYWLAVLPRNVVHRREAGTVPPTPPCGRR